MKTLDTSEYWALYYHIYLYIKKTGNYDMAMKLYKKPVVVKYFAHYCKLEEKQAK